MKPSIIVPAGSCATIQYAIARTPVKSADEMNSPRAVVTTTTPPSAIGPHPTSEDASETVPLAERKHLVKAKFVWFR
jgi:hypothetical protein